MKRRRGEREFLFAVLSPNFSLSVCLKLIIISDKREFSSFGSWRRKRTNKPRGVTKERKRFFTFCLHNEGKGERALTLGLLVYWNDGKVSPEEHFFISICILCIWSLLARPPFCRRGRPQHRSGDRILHHHWQKAPSSRDHGCNPCSRLCGLGVKLLLELNVSWFISLLTLIIGVDEIGLCCGNSNACCKEQYNFSPHDCICYSLLARQFMSAYQ